MDNNLFSKQKCKYCYFRSSNSYCMTIHYFIEHLDKEEER
jgi:hypothetical protein